ncbi:MAG: cytidine deaminase [Candidatus Gastranaerophilales bacterium]|nr:cytidine deaminase [Candidatus Gastranaerophilales bacterium]
MDKIYYELLEQAKEASKKAYAKYSNFFVGACALFESGEKFCGCNIENASYGLTICAERVAISNAIANGEKSAIKAIAIYSPNQKLCFPCGACRQWLSEFATNDDIKIILEDENDIKVQTLKELFPCGFKLND